MMRAGRPVDDKFREAEGLVGQGKKVRLIFIAVGSYWMVLGRRVMEFHLVF